MTIEDCEKRKAYKLSAHVGTTHWTSTFIVEGKSFSNILKCRVINESPKKLSDADGYIYLKNDSFDRMYNLKELSKEKYPEYYL